MIDLAGARILVAGAGVFGSATALALARAGAEILLADPAPFGANASGVAAGMLAPALEAALDPASADLFPLLKTARDCWSAFAADLPGVVLDRSGARFEGDPGAIEATRRRLIAQGAAVEPLGSGLYTPEDWRLEPLAVLGAMHARIRGLGGRLVAVTADGLIGETDVAVLACGFSGRHLAPELSCLIPIKGQILRFKAGAFKSGLVRRGASGYVAPSPSGALAGASMEEGVDDVQPDAATEARLQAMAVALAPELAGIGFTSAAGVRAATPDGLPLVGSSARSGVFLAAGARRNGWLLAPLVAEILVQQIGGGDPHPFAAALRPLRFSPPD